jgi:hypothetical protein
VRTGRRSKNGVILSEAKDLNRCTTAIYNWD